MVRNNNKEVFSMSTTAQKWGNSIGVRIPQKIAKKHGVVNGSVIQITENKQGILLKPITKDPTLEELMAQIPEDNQHDEIDFGKPEGDEIW